jgi:hypothetical protein
MCAETNPRVSNGLQELEGILETFSSHTDFTDAKPEGPRSERICLKIIKSFSGKVCNRTLMFGHLAVARTRIQKLELFGKFCIPTNQYLPVATWVLFLYGCFVLLCSVSNSSSFFRAFCKMPFLGGQFSGCLPHLLPIEFITFPLTIIEPSGIYYT